ncbi:hypothetical protein DVH05_022182 [Phytophthora capsici]|nr:hypothetical protein DVH05_022182 [Phytophthora capsici]
MSSVAEFRDAVAQMLAFDPQVAISVDDVVRMGAPLFGGEPDQTPLLARLKRFPRGPLTATTVNVSVEFLRFGISKASPKTGIASRQSIKSVLRRHNCTCTWPDPQRNLCVRVAIDDDGRGRAGKLQGRWLCALQDHVAIAREILLVVKEKRSKAFAAICIRQKAQIETLAGDCEMFDTFAMQQATMNGMLREIGGTRRMDTSRCRIVAASVCVNPLSRKVMMGIRIDTLAGTLDAEHRLVEEIRESGAVLRGMRAVAVCGDDVASALPVILDVAFDNAAIANVCEGEPFEVRAASGVGEVDRVTE